MSDTLRDRARWAYETARLRSASGWALPAILLWALAGGGALIAGLLAIVQVGLSWRGMELGRGNLPGLAVGSIGFVTPLLWEAVNGGCCAGIGCEAWCVAICGVGGGASGLVLYRHARRSGAARGTLFSALLVASLVVGIGCAQIGGLGLVGVGALWAATAPALWLRPVSAGL